VPASDMALVDQLASAFVQNDVLPLVLQPGRQSSVDLRKVDCPGVSDQQTARTKFAGSEFCKVRPERECAPVVGGIGQDERQRKIFDLQLAEIGMDEAY